MIHLIQHPSYTKITPDLIQPKVPYTCDYASPKEELGYQVVVYTDNPQGSPAKFELSFDGDYQVYLEKYVDVNFPHFRNDPKNGYIADQRDLLPDCLIPISSNDVFFINCNYIVLWVSITPDQEGTFKSVLRVSTENESASCELDLNVIKIYQKKQYFEHGEYIDPFSIVDDHGVAMFGDAFWKVLHNYYKLAANHGIKEILVPLYTPQYANYPRQKIIQLMKIKRNGNFYKFNFDLLDRWIQIATEAGIRNFTFPIILPDFDHPNGAPFIVEIDGEERIINETETVQSQEYTMFIRQFLKHLMDYLQKFLDGRRFAFHFSASPQVWNENLYCDLRSHFYDYVKKYRISDYDVELRFFKRELVGSPITHLHDVYEYSVMPAIYLNGCFDVSNPKDPINPLIASSSVRLRCLGAFGFRYDLCRFFHMGFNYTDSDNQYPDGSLSLVYPGEMDAYPSIRLKQLKYAFQDNRLMDTITSRYSPKRINGLIDRYLFNQDRYMDDPERYHKFRMEIYQLLENINKYNKGRF